MSSITTARAAIHTVGSDGACTHTTIAAAVAAAESHPGADTVRIASNQAYTAQAIVFTTSQELDLVGGFADCSQAQGSGNTTLDGSGGAPEPVLRIIGNTDAFVRLSHLTISGGDEDGSRAGGIDFSGDGILDIRNSVIAHNSGGEGGGIRAAGTGSNAELVIGENVGITFNTARYDGGGIWAAGLEMTMIDTGVLVAFNEAVGTVVAGQVVGGRGGGLYLYGGSIDGHGYIGSPSTNGVGPIYANTARRGGGICVYAGEDGYSSLSLFSTSYTDRTKLQQNFASEGGGALYLYAEDRGGFLIGHAANAYLRGVDLVDNTSVHAPIAWVQETGGTFPVGYSAVHINDDAATMHPAALPCPVGRACSSITGNSAEDGNGDPIVNPLVAVEEDNEFYLGAADVHGNRGSHFIRTRGDDVTIFNSAITGNLLGGNVVSSSGGDVTIESTTIAGNALGVPQVLDVDGNFHLQRSILWQPGLTSLSHSGGSSLSENVLTSERNSLDGGNSPYVLEAEPRFVDPGRADYHLRAASPAIDFAATGAGPDMEGNPRAIDLPIKDNLMGTADLGAYERQSLQPLVLNGDFDADLNLWNEIIAGAVAWDGTQNGSGAGGSGSIKVARSNFVGTEVFGASQCIHLPGPARYLLNGFGRGGGNGATRDGTSLRWELRRDGGEACNAGPPDVSGTHFLSASSAFVRPANPAVIDLAEADWTHNSSITILLRVVDNGIVAPPKNSAVGWFDGITLCAEGDDVIFADGFDPL
jgi:hypothetical protein